MTKDLTQGSPVRLILGFALPLLAGMLFQQLYNLVDTLIVGRFLGMEALAGVGATGSINFLVLGFCMGICSGFAIPVAQRFGAREESRMREFVANGVWLAIVFALVMTVMTVVYCDAILSAMNTPEDCFQQAYDYIVVIFAGIPFTFLYNLLSGWLRSLGDSKTPLFFLVLSSVLNVILDLFFILVIKLGVFGASLATVLSQAISGLLCLLFIAAKVPILHISRDEWRMQSGRMKLVKSKMDVLAELSEAVIMYTERAKREGMLLIYDEPDLFVPVFGDRGKLRQVFINVIDNALKYSDPGDTTTVSARVEGNNIIIEVEDTGCGISAADLPKIKTKFYKANLTRRGSGIGLAVADEIIQMHGGRLDVSSVEGEGTTVTITLPIMERGDDSTQISEATAEKAAPPSDAAVHLNKLDLSDIEDN